jgi:energy-converting hydrogenase B subunit D
VTEIQVIAMALVAVLGTAVVLTRDPAAQVVVLGLFGFSLAVLFIAFQAPDVALSAIVVSAVASPMMVLLTLARAKEEEEGED